LKEFYQRQRFLEARSHNHDLMINGKIRLRDDGMSEL